LNDRHFHRRNLPHLYYTDGIYFVTYRLIGSIHPNELKKLNEEISRAKRENREAKIFKKYDTLLDGLKSKNNYLSNPKIAEICKSTLHFPDRKDYSLICYTIMPNHIHVVFELLNKNKSVGDLMGAIKRNSAKDANNILGFKGAFWQAESFDRLVREDKELYFVIRYVLMNPVNAGLVGNWRDWKYTYCHPDFIVID
jgi:putative transposase